MKRKDEELENIEIHYIGDELKFQRLYYNRTHDKTIELGDCNAEGDYEVLSVKLADYLYSNKIIKEEKIDGISDKVLKTIEENNYKIYPICKLNNSSVQEPSKHYFEMYFMFKIYGYLDEYDIFKIFKKYNILEQIEKDYQHKEILSEGTEIRLKKIKEYKQRCLLEYEKDNSKIFINLMNPFVVSNINDIRCFLQQDLQDKHILTNRKFLENIVENPHEKTFLQIFFGKFKRLMLNKFEELTEFQRKYTSLDIGKETGFIENVLKGEDTFVTLETMQKILEYLKLQNSDMYYFIHKRIEQKSTIPIKSQLSRRFEEI